MQVLSDDWLRPSWPRSSPLPTSSRWAYTASYFSTYSVSSLEPNPGSISGSSRPSWDSSESHCTRSYSHGLTTISSCLVWLWGWPIWLGRYLILGWLRCRAIFMIKLLSKVYFIRVSPLGLYSVWWCTSWPIMRRGKEAGSNDSEKEREMRRIKLKQNCYNSH